MTVAFDHATHEPKPTANSDIIELCMVVSDSVALMGSGRFCFDLFILLPVVWNIASRVRRRREEILLLHEMGSWLQLAS